MRCSHLPFLGGAVLKHVVLTCRTSSALNSRDRRLKEPFSISNSLPKFPSTGICCLHHGVITDKAETEEVTVYHQASEASFGITLCAEQLALPLMMSHRKSNFMETQTMWLMTGTGITSIHSSHLSLNQSAQRCTPSSTTPGQYAEMFTCPLGVKCVSSNSVLMFWLTVALHPRLCSELLLSVVTRDSVVFLSEAIVSVLKDNFISDALKRSADVQNLQLKLCFIVLNRKQETWWRQIPAEHFLWFCGFHWLILNTENMFLQCLFSCFYDIQAILCQITSADYFKNKITAHFPLCTFNYWE